MRQIALIVTLVGLTACPKDDGSNLEKMAAKREAASSTAADPAEKKAGDDADAEDGTTKQDPTKAGPKSGLLTPGEGEKVELRFALPDDTTYAVTTIGLLTLPAVQRPIGFARREEITLSNCDGDGYTRACDLTHEITNYEAEQPEGRPLEIGEKPVLELTTKHRMDASGRREGKTTVEGENADDPAARALEEAHRFFCLRLPTEPVGVGAVWADTCKMRTGGQVVTKEAKWELKKLDDDPDGGGRRAEVHMQAKYTATDSDGNPREGVSRGILYLWADAGEPHLYKEMIALPLGSTGMKTKTSLNYQFAKVDPKDPEKVLRTDGKEFPGFRTLNEVRAEDGDEPDAPDGAQ
jgi:hypothetical protein